MQCQGYFSKIDLGTRLTCTLPLQLCLSLYEFLQYLCLVNTIFLKLSNVNLKILCNRSSISSYLMSSFCEIYGRREYCSFTRTENRVYATIPIAENKRKGNYLHHVLPKKNLRNCFFKKRYCFF